LEIRFGYWCVHVVNIDQLEIVELQKSLLLFFITSALLIKQLTFFLNLSLLLDRSFKPNTNLSEDSIKILRKDLTHTFDFMNIKMKNFTTNFGFDREVSFEFEIVIVPIMNVETVLFRASDDVDKAVVIVFTNIDVRQVLVFRKYELSCTRHKKE
jgi:hypothetical protein